MDHQSHGFLNDTSLSKTPKSPLKTSTVLRHNQRRSSSLAKQKANHEAGGSYNQDNCSFAPLNEVTNNPSFAALKMKFNESSFADDRNSSLGILQMDNFSDFTDTSIQNVAAQSQLKVKSKKITKSKLFNTNKIDLVKKKCFPDTTILSAENFEEYHNAESCSSSDIENDGTNIPKLNLNYDPSPHKSKESLLNDKLTEKTEQKSELLMESSIQNNTDYSTQSRQSSRISEFVSNSCSKPRDSIFENFDPAYDSIFKSFLPSDAASEINSTNMSEIMKAPLNFDLSLKEKDSIFKDQTLAELNFMKILTSNGQSSPFKFCPKEISARSSSFRSDESSNTFNSYVSDSCSKSLAAEGFVNEVINHFSGLETSDGKNESNNFIQSFSDKSSAKGSLSNEDTSFKGASGVSSNISNFSEKAAEDHIYPSDLNFKDMSVFVSNSLNKEDQFEDSDFMSPGQALEVFKKDEEIMNEEKKLEIGNVSKSSALSISSIQDKSNISTPSWYLDLHHDVVQHPERISIGTLIGARTECLGRLSNDSKRERPFFGLAVTTPIREVSEGSVSEIVEDTPLSLKNESATISSQLENFSAFCETPKSHFENPGALGNNASALRDVLQNLPSPSGESGLFRASALSEFLNEQSTDSPLKLASGILDKCYPSKEKTTNSNAFSSAKDRTFSPDSTLSSPKRNTTLTRSFSVEDITSITPQTNLKKNLSISNVALNDANAQKNNRGCPSCQQPKIPVMVSRPPSSCSTLCGNPSTFQNQHVCMRCLTGAQEHRHQNLYSSWGSIPRSDNGSHSCVNYPCIPGSQMPQQTPNCVQVPLAAPGSTYFVPNLQGPSELVFPEKLCIGDSQCMSLTVQNLPNLHFYLVSFVSATLNNEPVSSEIACVSFPGMVPCGTGNTTNIQITLSPKYEGNLIVTLQLVASYNSVNMALSSFSNLSLQTKIKYESIRPCISISSKGHNKLDLEKVVPGTTVIEYITIFNRCEATVPLHLSLSNDSHDNHITFGLNQMKGQKYPSAMDWKMLSPKTMKYRLPCTKNASIESHIDIPIVFEAGNQNADVRFTLTATLDSYMVRETLGWFRVLASVKSAKLVLADSKENRVCLNARTGSSCSKNLNVQNESSCPMIYDLEISENDGSFSVSPSSLSLKPMQSSSVCISFSPKSPEDVKGVLHAAAQPHRKIVKVAELYGNVKRSDGPSRSSIHNPLPEREPRRAEQKPKEAYAASSGHNILECNKRYLCWGGIDVGSTVIKTFDIKNSLNKCIKAKLFVKDKSNCFKILEDGNQHVDNLTMSLNPKEKRTVSVIFAPTKIELASGFLVVKPLLEKDPKIFSMPLSGYGGSGKLKVTQVSEKEGIGSCLEIVLPAERRTVFNSILVHNSGVRAIFVKAFFSPAASSGCSNEVQVSIDPQEFVLCDKENKTLYISYASGGLFGSHSGDCGVITLLYGDEVLRQQLKRSSNDTTRLTQNDLIRNMNFDGHFSGEEKVPYDPLYQCIPRIFSVFNMNVKRYLIHLNVVEQNASYSHMTFDAMPTMNEMFPEMFNSVLHSRRLTTVSAIHHSPPVQDFTVNMLNRLSMPLTEHSYIGQLLESSKPKKEETPVENRLIEEKVASESWAAKPEVLIMDSSSKDNRISLVNLVHNDLKFRIISAIDVISVSPVSGTIPAKGEIGLRITTIPLNYGKLFEDYKGYIKIICDGREKEVLVNVLKDPKKTAVMPESNLNIKIDQESISEDSFSDKIDHTIIGPPSVFIKNICNFPKEITLSTTVPGKVSENCFAIKNSEKSCAQWQVRPISTLFTESLNDSSMLPQILQIKPTSGTLKPSETGNIVMKFVPPRQDNFSQFFELLITFENGVNQKCNFKVYAKASTCLTESTENSRPPDNSENSRKGSKNSVYIENENCEFPNTALGQCNVAYATITNGTSQDVTLDIIKPHLPFTVSHSSIVVRSKKFLQIPIKFMPTDIHKVYEDVLLLHSNDGHHFMVYLKGKCIGKKKGIL